MLRGFASALAATAIILTCGASAPTTAQPVRVQIPDIAYTKGAGPVLIHMNHSCGM